MHVSGVGGRQLGVGRVVWGEGGGVSAGGDVGGGVGGGVHLCPLTRQTPTRPHQKGSPRHSPLTIDFCPIGRTASLCQSSSTTLPRHT